MREIILRFEMNFFLDRIIHIRIFKQVPKYLATGLIGDGIKILKIYRLIACSFTSRSRIFHLTIAVEM
jgi:hypothetical protein